MRFLSLRGVPREHRLLAGSDDAEIWAWLRSGFALWHREGGALDLPRCLRLPTTPAAVARVVRYQSFDRD
jgi:hypothetical protein